MTPFYKHLHGIPGFGVASSVDLVGLGATAAVGAAFAGHGVISIAKRFMQRRGERGGEQDAGEEREQS
jgi:hypothetical protein